MVYIQPFCVSKLLRWGRLLWPQMVVCAGSYGVSVCTLCMLLFVSVGNVMRGAVATGGPGVLSVFTAPCLIIVNCIYRIFHSIQTHRIVMN